MSNHPIRHLGADDLDAIHNREASAERLQHVTQCNDCRALVIADRRLLVALGELPSWEPADGFAAQVIVELGHQRAAMAGAVRAPTRSMVGRAVRARRRLAFAGAAAGILVATGFTWMLANPTMIANLVGPMIGNLSRSIWLMMQGLAATLLNQPWPDPVAAIPLLLAAAGMYVIMLIGFRRVLTRPATDADW